MVIREELNDEISGISVQTFFIKINEGLTCNSIRIQDYHYSIGQRELFCFILLLLIFWEIYCIQG